MCKQLPQQPPNSQPTILPSRPLLTIARAYVDLSTGVGPEPAQLVPFNTLLLTPLQGVDRSSLAAAAFIRPAVLEALDGGSTGMRPAAVLATPRIAAASGQPLTVNRSIPPLAAPRLLAPRVLPAEYLELAARYKPPACPNGTAQDASTPAAQHPDHQLSSPESDPCVQSLVGLSQCTPKGSTEVCCRFVEEWSAAGCWCQPSGLRLLDNMPTSMTPVLLQLLGWVCDEE